jgi:xanthine dehydrogenase YagT iron-sulfur-binding subunit
MSSSAIHIVNPTEFDLETAQAPGSERRAAIAPSLGVASATGGGLFEVAAGSRMGIHHHGKQETMAYVLSGICDIRWGARGDSIARATAGDFIRVPACRTWKSTRRNRSRFDGLSCAAPRRLSRSTFRTTPGRKPDVFCRRKAGRKPDTFLHVACGLGPDGAVMDESETNSEPFEVTRRTVIETGTTALLLAALPRAALAAGPADEPPPPPVTVDLQINGRLRSLTLDPRTTLLDALREHLALTGSKKGCDHGQCGACTVLIDKRRINSCLTLAVMHDGDSITTIEGLADRDHLHPLQAAFIEHDGFQCGYCTSGQICSAIGMLAESRQSVPSYVTADLANPPAKLTDAEIRERMSGNICRCAAYPNIVAAIKQAAGRST